MEKKNNFPRLRLALLALTSRTLEVATFTQWPGGRRVAGVSFPPLRSVIRQKKIIFLKSRFNPEHPETQYQTRNTWNLRNPDLCRM